MQVSVQRAHSRTHSTTLTPDDIAAAAEMLARVESNRRDQLAALAPATDAVARAHRASVQRILDAIATARAQVSAGTFGRCARCDADLEPDSLRARPWAVWCRLCSQR